MNTEKYNDKKLLLTSDTVDLLGGIHGEPENDGFHNQNFDYFRFQVYQTINRAKVNISMSDIKLEVFLESQRMTAFINKI